RVAAGFRAQVEKQGPRTFGMFSCSKTTNELNLQLVYDYQYPILPTGLHFLLPSLGHPRSIPYHINTLAEHPMEPSLPLIRREVYMHLPNLHLPKLNYDKLKLPKRRYLLMGGAVPLAALVSIATTLHTASPDALTIPERTPIHVTLEPSLAT